jgi:hypothetical protein
MYQERTKFAYRWYIWKTGKETWRGVVQNGPKLSVTVPRAYTFLSAEDADEAGFIIGDPVYPKSKIHKVRRKRDESENNPKGSQEKD